MSPLAWFLCTVGALCCLSWASLVVALVVMSVRERRRSTPLLDAMDADADWAWPS